MRIVFAGSPEYALPTLKRLYEKFGVVCVITQPDKPLGRKRILTPTPIKQYALDNGIKVFTFTKIREHIGELQNLGDILITCAYGQILTQGVLSSFPLGVWNLHASLLPKFRGASPIQSAILEGETHTGVTVMKTELALDTGDILLVKRCEIGNKTCGELASELSVISADCAEECVELIKGGKTQLLLQDEPKATYCKKIKKEYGKIDFNNSPDNICRLIRAYNPEPIAFCTFLNNPLNILYAEPDYNILGEIGHVICADKQGITVGCKGGSVVIKELIPSGGKRMAARDFVNGRKIKVGDKLD